ncbi:DNA polymerase III subunit beta [Nocardiopsis synnemataformans]|uniref:DNA polymerase III subunit beta n=1 Tax=Nocardiopsis synnemataformans TaxID=61305 RepID=UPI003EBE9B65
MITATVPALRQALAATKLACAPRPVIPILTGVLIRAEAGQVSLTTTDYDHAVTAHVDGASATADSVTCVPHAVLADLLAGLTKGTGAHKLATTTVTLAPHPSQPVLSLLGYEVPIESLPAEDFPELPDLDQAPVTVAGSVFTDSLARVMVAHDPTVEIEVLTAACLESRDGQLHITTANRYRLATARLPLEGYAGEFAALVDGTFLTKLGKLLTGATVTVEVDRREEGGGFVRLRSGDITALLRLMEGEYVTWRAFLPESWPDGPSTTLTTDRAALVELTDKAAVIAKAKGRRMAPVVLDANDTGVTVGPEDATVTPRLRAELANGSGAYRIRANPAFLRAALAAIPGERVTLYARSATSTLDPPVVFTAADHDPTHYQHAVMPIRS